MIKKSTVDSAHKLYYLNGLVECARIVIKKEAVLIAFSSADNSSFIGNIKCASFYGNYEGTIGVYNTTQLLKLLKILDKNITIDVQVEKDIANKLLISDNQYDLEYCLADVNLIKPTRKVKEPIYDLDLDLSNDDYFIDNFINAKKALGDISKFEISVNGGKVNFTLGEGSFSNKIKFHLDIEDKAIKISPMNFSANVFNEILAVNSSLVEGSIKISREGLINVSFSEDDLASQYFLIKLDV